MGWQNLREEIEQEFAAESRFSIELAEHAFKMALRAQLMRESYAFEPAKSIERAAVWRANNPEAAKAIQHRYDTSPKRKAARAQRQRQRRADKRAG